MEPNEFADARSERDSPRLRRLGRSIGAVLAGIVAGVALTIGTDLVMHATRIFPPFGQPMSDGLFLLATVYRTVFSILAGYLVARLSPDRPMAHALVSGVIGFAVCVIGAVAMWNSDLGPHWYPLALVALALPCAWAGGKLRVMQLSAAIAGVGSVP